MGTFVDYYDHHKELWDAHWVQLLPAKCSLEPSVELIMCIIQPILFIKIM